MNEREKQPEYRTVPIPKNLFDEFDLVFSIRREIKNKKQKDILLWSEKRETALTRNTAWRMVKRVMQRAGIEGKKATSKGLRHGFGIAMVQKGVSLHIVAKLLGHSDTSTTEIYTNCSGAEQHEMVMNVWKED